MNVIIGYFWKRTFFYLILRNVLGHLSNVFPDKLEHHGSPPHTHTANTVVDNLNTHLYSYFRLLACAYQIWLVVATILS